MKKIIPAVVLTVLLAGTLPSVAEDSNKDKSPADRWTDSQKFSYILGGQLGQLSKTNDLGIDMEMVARGLDDFITGKEPVMSPREVQEFMADFQRKTMEKEQAALRATADENLKKGQEFLEANKKKDGVKVTSSGLQYKVIAGGDGPRPEATDKVKVHYRGTLIDGKEFDSSYSRNRPAEFVLSQVIKGWTEGLQLMNAGSKYEFYIPSNLAYGVNAPPTIGPNQVLIFEVELLGIIK